MSYPPRLRFRHYKNFKLGRRFALHLRHSKLVSLSVILLTLPLFLIIILFNFRSTTPTIPDPAPPSQAIPPTTDRTTITIPQYLRILSQTHPHPNNTISLLAACMNRRDTLNFTLASWLSIPQITQIIIVDWTSTPAITPIHHQRISLIRVDNADSWILSRAYNLASKFAIGKYILKVDCDTHLEPTFINTHPLPPLGTYYTAYTTDNNTPSHPLRGVWFAHTHDFLRIGGYDERIIHYGYEDTDLYRRFDQFLQPIPLHLESVRHHTHPVHSHATPHKLSTLINAALLGNASSWKTSEASTYTFSYAQSENIIYASITHNPPPLHESTSIQIRDSLKTRLLEQTLHEHGLPLTLIQGLDLSDQQFLAAYFERDPNNYVIVALLNSDTLGNIFNLVSALQAGITSGRPVIAIWKPVDTATLNSLIHVAETNERLRNVVQTVSARRHGFSQASRLIPAKEWGCIDTSCTNDLAYKQFVMVGGKQSYDERNPLPISLKHHAFVSLNGTKVGGAETRKLAYGCITWSDAVKKMLGTFREDVGIVAEGDVTRIDVRPKIKGFVGVVGRHTETVRQLLGSRICERCDENDVVVKVANALAVVSARQVVPHVVEEKVEWTRTTSSIVADLRSLHGAL